MGLIFGGGAETLVKEIVINPGKRSQRVFEVYELIPDRGCIRYKGNLVGHGIPNQISLDENSLLNWAQSLAEGNEVKIQDPR